MSEVMDVPRERQNNSDEPCGVLLSLTKCFDWKEPLK
jgi:hypothetical protein